MDPAIGLEDVNVLVDDFGMLNGRFEVATVLGLIGSIKSYSCTKLYYVK